MFFNCDRSGGFISLAIILISINCRPTCGTLYNLAALKAPLTKSTEIGQHWKNAYKCCNILLGSARRGSCQILSANYLRQQTKSSALFFTGRAGMADVTLKALLSLQIFHPPFSLLSAPLISSSLHISGVEIHSVEKHQKWVWLLMIWTLIYYLSVEPFLLNLPFSSSADFPPFSTSFMKTKRAHFSSVSSSSTSHSSYQSRHSSILTSTQFPSTSWKRTQNGSDLEATSRSSRLVAVTDSSTRVTQCWGATLRVWPSVVELRV